jgi:hypothetical protein
MTLAASTITYSGSSGLTLNADGDGNSTSQSANVRLMPTGGLTATSNRLVGTLSWSQSFPNTPWGTNAPLSVSGASNSPLNISANGSYGAINVSGNGVTFAGGPLTAESMGENTAIYIYYTDGLGTFGDFIVNNTGAVKFDASGVSAAGGTVVIYADDTEINNATTFRVAANGPASGNGDGGVIDFQTNTSDVDVLTKVKLSADAASAGSGNAVYADPTDSMNVVAITFYTGATTFLDIGTDNGQFSFSANGGSTGGDAGAMRIITPSTVRVQTDDAINASALAGNGKGGWVWLSYIDAILDGYTAVILQGHGTGVGGRFVSGNFVFGSFDVNRNINVDGGSSLLSSSENDYGYISLNDVICQQRTSGQATWPQAYWNCVNPSSSTAQDQVPVDLAKTSTFNGVRSLYTSNGVNLYVFPDNTAFNDFFNKSAPALVGGVTSQQYPGGTISVAPWLTGAIGSNTVITYSANQLKEVTAHELGHASDISHGESNDSQSSLFDSFMARDFNTLDFADPSFTISRLPCARTVNPAHPLPTDPLHFFPGAAPFDGVTWLLPDNSTVSVCVPSGVPGVQVLNPTYFGPTTTNRQVVEAMDAYIFDPLDPADRWIEAHAQSFAYAAVGNLGSTANVDPLLDKGYFPCAVSWGNTERSGTLPSSACTLSPL